MSDEFRGDEFRIEGVKARYERLKFFALSEISLKYVYQEHNNELERLFNKDSLNGEDIRVLAAHVLSKRALELWLKDSGNDQKTSDEIENIKQADKCAKNQAEQQFYPATAG